MIRELACLALRTLIARASRLVTGEGRPARYPSASRPPAARSDSASSAGPRPSARANFDGGEAGKDLARVEPLPYDPEPLDGMLVTDGSWCALTGCPNRADIYRNHVPWCQRHYLDGEAIAYLEQRWAAAP